MDGEPWLQPAAQIEVDFRGTALMLRRLESAPLARMAAGVTEALEACQVTGHVKRQRSCVLSIVASGTQMLCSSEHLLECPACAVAS